MKVTCKSCGKRFDPEKTTYMCPKCGSWYVEKKSTAQFEYDRPAAQSSESDEMQYTSQAEPEYRSSDNEWKGQTGGSKRNTKNLIVIICAVIIGIVSGIAGLVDSYKIDSGDDYYENDWDKDDNALSRLYESVTIGEAPARIVTDCAVGTPIEVTDEMGESKWCTVLSVKQAELPGLDVPAGYELYEIDYQVADYENDQSEFEKREHYINCDLNLRIRTRSGTILTPLISYDLAMLKSKGDALYDDKDYDEQRTYWSDYVDENYIDIDIDEYRGKLLFLVAEGDFDRMVMYNTYEDDNEKDVENIFIFAGDEEKTAKSKVLDYDWIVSSKTEDADAAYIISPNVYIQKIEKDAVFTPYKGVNIRCMDLLDEGKLEEFDSYKDDEDWYLMALRMTNISSDENVVPYVYRSYSSDVDFYIDSVYYSPVCESGAVPPMTTATMYYIVRVEKGYSGDIYMTYNNISKDKKYLDSEFTVSLP